MVRDKKRTGTYRGKRRQGKGNVKNRGRKSGHGGTGNAGLRKHKKSWVVKFDKDHYGRNGFKRSSRVVVPSINLYQLERMIINGEIKKVGEKYPFVFEGKILGSGYISYPISVKASSWSKKAEEKIKKVSGELSQLTKKN